MVHNVYEHKGFLGMFFKFWFYLSWFLSNAWNSETSCDFSFAVLSTYSWLWYSVVVVCILQSTTWPWCKHITHTKQNHPKPQVDLQIHCQIFFNCRKTMIDGIKIQKTTLRQPLQLYITWATILCYFWSIFDGYFKIIFHNK